MTWPHTLRGSLLLRSKKARFPPLESDSVQGRPPAFSTAKLVVLRGSATVTAANVETEAQNRPRHERGPWTRGFRPCECPRARARGRGPDRRQRHTFNSFQGCPPSWSGTRRRTRVCKGVFALERDPESRKSQKKP